MRLQLILPHIEPIVITLPIVCPYEDCEGAHFDHHQKVIKPLKDTVCDAVTDHRHKCLRCGWAFRVYPQGVTNAQTSQRVKGLGAMLYLLGLSYGAVSLALEALDAYIGKSSVWQTVQSAALYLSGPVLVRTGQGDRTGAERGPGMKRQ
jgi:hypothetical protein